MVATSITETSIDLDARLIAHIDARVQALLDRPATKPRKLALVARKGSLDWAYLPLMMANNACPLRRCSGFSPA